MIGVFFAQALIFASTASSNFVEARYPVRILSFDLIREIFSHMDSIDRLSFFLSMTSKEAEIQKLPNLSLSRKQSLQYMTDESIFRVVNACVEFPALHDDFFRHRVEILDEGVASITPGIVRLADTLVELSLKNTQISDLSLLRTHTKLKALVLSNTLVHNLDALRYFRSPLGWLYLSNTRVEDISALGALRHLSYLILDRLEHIVLDLSPLARCTLLKFINLEGTNFHVGSLDMLVDLRNLQLIKIASAQSRNHFLGVIDRAIGNGEGVLGQVTEVKQGALGYPMSIGEKRKIGKLGQHFDVFIFAGGQDSTVYLRRSRYQTLFDHLAND